VTHLVSVDPRSKQSSTPRTLQKKGGQRKSLAAAWRVVWDSPEGGDQQASITRKVDTWYSFSGRNQVLPNHSLERFVNANAKQKPGLEFRTRRRSSRPD